MREVNMENPKNPELTPGTRVVVLTPRNTIGYTGLFLGYADEDENRKAAIKPDDSTLEDVMYANPAATILQPETCNEAFKLTEEGQELMDRRDELSPDEFDTEWDRGLELMHNVGACAAPACN